MGYEWVTDSMFNRKLAELINRDLGTDDDLIVRRLMDICGDIAYHEMSEKYNNRVLEELEREAWENNDDYMMRKREGRHHCPFCDSNHKLYRDPPAICGDGLIERPMDCHNCNASWNEIYQVVGYEILHEQED